MESFLRQFWVWVTERIFPVVFQVVQRQRWCVFFAIGILLTSVGFPALSKTAAVPATTSVASGTEHYRRGEQDYRTEQFFQAAEHFQQAAQDFEAQGKRLNQARALSNLSLAQQSLGEWEAAKDAIARSLQLSGLNRSGCQAMQARAIPKLSASQLKVLAPSLDIYGRLWYLQGEPSCALYSWQLAADLYQKQPEQAHRAIGSQINQVQALKMLGRYQQARTTANQIQNALKQQPNSLLKARGLRSFGDILRTVGELEHSQEILEQSLGIAKQLDVIQDISATYLSLGNTWKAMGDLERDRQAPIEYEHIPWRCKLRTRLPSKAKVSYDQAKKNYQQASAQSQASAIQLRAQLNLLSLIVETNDLSTANSLVNTIDLSALPQSRTKVYARINFAKNQACLQQALPGGLSLRKSLDRSQSSLVEQIERAIAEAQQLNDQRAESYATGNLGGLYEYFGWRSAEKDQQSAAQQYRQIAQQFTRKALLLTSSHRNPDVAYQWQWQLGQLLDAEGKPEAAITNYEAAVKSLEAVRGDLLTIASDVQFNFRDSVEPLYRELVALLLERGRNPNSLGKSLYYVDSLQLAELENFLQCNLTAAGSQQGIQSDDLDDAIAQLGSQLNQVTQNDPTVALIYPVLLQDRISVILKLPGQAQLRYHRTEMSADAVNAKLTRLRTLLKKPLFTRTGKKLLQEVYSWLIEPFEAELAQNQIKTLAFVPDVAFRDIPMAALYDGEAYLLQKQYSVAIAPSAQLIRPPLAKARKVKALIAGLTQERDNPNSTSLKVVQDQADGIAAIVDDQVTMLDEKFTRDAFKREISTSPYTLIHLASHGIFSSDLKETYILTGDKPGHDRLNINELETVLQARDTTLDPIQLLVLSACETARGDKRATLGISGVAVKSGARSTLAPLWFADQKATTLLIVQFYKNLIEQPEISTAEALRLAQKSLLEDPDSSFKAPRHWASFVLVGDWS